MLTLVRAIYLLLLLLFAPLATADVGLLHACLDVDAQSKNTGTNPCMARAWLPATPELAVLSCPPDIPEASCRWGAEDYRWQKLKDLPPTALVNRCEADIPPGPFAPPRRPVVDAKCEDPCGCGGPLDRKRNVPKATLPGFVPPAYPYVRNAPRVSWTAPTQDIEGNPLEGQLTMRLYTAPNCQSPSRTLVGEYPPNAGTVFMPPQQKSGPTAFIVAAVNEAGEGEPACLMAIIRPAAPSNGSIERPTEGSIERTGDRDGTSEIQRLF